MFEISTHPRRSLVGAHLAAPDLSQALIEWDTMLIVSREGYLTYGADGMRHRGYSLSAAAGTQG
ncbi:hypothetical protein AAW14_34920 [Streptomyces hygroscopicus]|nr:hypothetical protein [Streptomyces hygroscopicus]